MTLTIDLPAPVQAALEADARAQALPLAEVLTRVLAEHYAVHETGAATTPETLTPWETLLDSLEEGDPAEQRETLAWLQTALDADRPGQRRLFGPG